MERPLLDSPLKWAGGKRWIIELLKKEYTPGRRLVDPFCGGLSVPLGLRPNECMFSDANVPLMNFWRWVQHGLDFEDGLGFQFKHEESVYYENRRLFNSLCTTGNLWTKEGALLFYYLNRSCFNGLCRFNSSGEFNVPFGRYTNINYRKDFYEYVAVLRGWELYHGDFATLPLRGDDFIYADPPYDVPFTKYTPGDFDWEDQLRLARWLADHKGPVIVSNQGTQRVIDLYQNLGFNVFYLEGPRRIAANGNRSPALEMYATKNL